MSAVNLYLSIITKMCDDIIPQLPSLQINYITMVASGSYRVIVVKNVLSILKICGISIFVGYNNIFSLSWLLEQYRQITICGGDGVGW